MKKLLYLTTIIVALFTLSFCFSSCSPTTPEAVAEKYFEAFIVEDYKTMQSLSTQTEAAKYDEEMLQEGAKSSNAEKQEFMAEMNKAKRTYEPAEFDPEDPNKAKVKVVLAYPVIEGEEAEIDEMMVKLQKEDDAWKVDGVDIK